MLYVVYLLVGVLTLIAAMLLLRVRVRLELSKDRQLLFFGLGHTGPVRDFRSKKTTLQLFGETLEHLWPSVEAEAAEPPVKPPRRRPTRKKAKARRRPPIREVLKVGRISLPPIRRFVFGLLKKVSFEELEAEIRAGFASPDLTGQAYGYYQAALAAAPSMVGRVRYYPDFDGLSFSGALRVTAALPLYQLVFRMLVLLTRLPIRRILTLLIRKREGDSDVQQRG